MTDSIANGYFTASARVFSVARAGSVTISGPGCKGTWKYSITTDRTLALTGPAALGSTMNYAGVETLDGTVALRHWHAVIAVTEQVTPRVL